MKILQVINGEFNPLVDERVSPEGYFGEILLQDTVFLVVYPLNQGF
jgi:hypothetical protein